MRRGLLGLVLALAVVAAPADAASPVKPGATCLKQGTTKIQLGKKYQCIRSRGRLVWNKGVSVPKAKASAAPVTTPVPSAAQTLTPTPTSTPSPTPSPTPALPPTRITPWQTTIREQDLAYSALQRFKDWRLSDRGAPIAMELALESSLPIAVRQDIQQLAEFTASLLGRQGVHDVVVIAGTTEDWMNVQLKQRGIGARNPAWPDGMKISSCISDPNSNSFCSDGSKVVLLMMKNPQDYLDRAPEHSAVAHEYFHLLAGKLMAGRSFRYGEEYPGWFFEGAPSFFAAAAIAELGTVDYLTSRRALIQVGSYRQHSRKPLARYIDNVFPDIYIYGIGQVAIEYIVASCGFDAVLDIYRRLGEGQAFAVSFEAATGMTLDEFYARFDKIQDAAGI